MTDPISLVPAKTDRDIAEELKRLMIEKLVPVLLVLDEANALGFEMSFNLGRGPFGKQAITMLKVAKEF